MESISLITIGYAKRALHKGSREHDRLFGYAHKLKVFHCIVFTKRGEGFAVPVSHENFTVYPTNSRTRIHMLYDAMRIGIRIIQQTPQARWVVSSQDPFETSLVGRVISWCTKAKHHVQVHGDNFGDTSWRRESILNYARYLFGWYIVRTSMRIRVASHRIQASLVQKGVKENCIHVLPIRPELDRFLTIEHMYRKQPPYTFIYVGRFAPEKNIERIVRSFKYVIDRFPNTYLRLIGEGVLTKSIQSHIRERRLEAYVTIEPWNEHIEKSMNDADALVLASHHEAYGLVLVEAMAIGLPVITTDVGCVGEVVRDGEHGIVVRDTDDTSYAHALCTLLENPLLVEKYGRSAKEVARTLGEQTEDAYQNAWIQSLT